MDTEATNDPVAAALLNLAAVVRMMYADGEVAPAEAELFAELLDAADLSDDVVATAREWSTSPPGEETVAELTSKVDGEARGEALALAWVTAHADGQVRAEEIVEHDRLAALLGMAEEAQGTRDRVEARFFGAALTVLGGLSAMARLDGGPAAEDWYEDAVGGMGLPSALAERARRWIDEPRPLHEVLSEASTLAPDFQEALLGNLYAAASAEGPPDGPRMALFDRFKGACGVADARVAQLIAEWGPDAGDPGPAAAEEGST